MQILNFDRQIMAWHRSNEASKRLDEIPGVVPRSPPLWSPASLIRRLSDLDGIFPPGLGWCRSNIRAGARTSSAASANRAIGICAACSRQARCPSSAMPRSMAPNMPWLTTLLARRPTKVVAIALANKIAQGTRRTRGVTKIAPDIWRDVKVGRANST